jgi:hypothetical protein
MSDINNQIRARLKQLHCTPGYGWWLDKDCEEVPYDQWALLLSDRNNTQSADEAGYVAIVPTQDWRWAIRFVIADEWGHGPGVDDLSFVTNTLQEAKRHVDMLLGFDTPDIPILGNSDPH